MTIVDLLYALHVPMAGEEYDAAVDSLGSLMEDVARRVTKAVQHYEDASSWTFLDALVVDSESSEIIFLLFGSLSNMIYYSAIMPILLKVYI